MKALVATRFAIAAVALALAAGAAGCDGGGGGGSRPAVELGERLYNDAALSTSDFNDFTCATCHSAIADEGVLRTAGFPLANSAHRPGWWNRKTPQYLDAVNACLVFFMRSEAIEPGDPYGDALYEYLVSISPEDPSPEVPFTVVRTVPIPAAGAATAGQAVYDASCRNCHGDPVTGNGRLTPAATALGPDLSSLYDTMFPGISHDVIVAEKVRHGNLFGIGGNMPFFAVERMSDGELADLLAYLDL